MMDCVTFLVASVLRESSPPHLTRSLRAPCGVAAVLLCVCVVGVVGVVGVVCVVCVVGVVGVVGVYMCVGDVDHTAKQCISEC